MDVVDEKEEYTAPDNVSVAESIFSDGSELRVSLSDEEEEEEEEDDDDPTTGTAATTAAAAAGTPSDDTEEIPPPVEEEEEEECVIINNAPNNKRPVSESDDVYPKKAKVDNGDEDVGGGGDIQMVDEEETEGGGQDSYEEIEHFTSFAELPYGSWFFVGQPGSGKTSAIRTYLWDIFIAAKRESVAFIPNINTGINDEYVRYIEIVPSYLVFPRFYITRENNIVRWLNKTFDRDQKFVLVYDDVEIAGKPTKYNSYLENLVTKGSRHLNANIIVTSQYYTNIAPGTRTCFTYYVFIINSRGRARTMQDIVQTCKLESHSTTFLQLERLVSSYFKEKLDCRLIIVFDNYNKKFYIRDFDMPPTSSEMSDYINRFRIPPCFVKRGDGGTRPSVIEEEEGKGNDGGGGDDDDDGEQNDGGDDLRSKVERVEMLGFIKGVNPELYDVLKRSNACHIIEKEFQKAKAIEKLNNKVNCFLVFYNILFTFMERVGDRFNVSYCRGLTEYRSNYMSSKQKAYERDLINNAIQYYFPNFGETSPILDLFLHTITIIMLARTTYTARELCKSMVDNIANSGDGHRV